MEEQFQQLFEKYTADAKIAQSKSSAIGWFRLTLFIGGLSLAVWCVQLQQFALVAIILFLTITVFSALVNLHNKIRRRVQLLQEKAAINKEELARLKFDFDGLDDGSQFIDSTHTYSQDLDLFGRHSLYQFIHRRGTDLGATQLVAFLSTPSSIEAAQKRQISLKELSENVDWRQEFQAHARLVDHEKTAHNKLYEWMEEDTPLLNKKMLSKIVIGLSMIIPAIAIAGIFLDWSWLYIFGLMAINGTVWRGQSTAIQKNKSTTEHHLKLLKSYFELFELMENVSVSSERLKEIQSQIDGASKQIGKLRKAFEYLDYSNNALFGILANGFFNWDFLWTLRIEKWKSSHASKTKEWFKLLGEFETLSAAAATVYAQPNWQWPTLDSNLHGLSGKGIAHPLIKEKGRISNNYDLTNSGKVHLLTGSNMSGKSTFLRTIGINIVLARAGFPVCAQSMTCGPISLYTSMRTTDSIEESTSSFYAELKRLKRLIDLATTKDHVIYMLDEILKGTNSKDRHLGAKALVKQLSGLGATGIVSTHDIELSILEETDDYLTNYSFNSTINGDEIIFDYTLTPGPCKSFNASKLMEKMGFDMELSESQLML